METLTLFIIEIADRSLLSVLQRVAPLLCTMLLYVSATIIGKESTTKRLPTLLDLYLQCDGVTFMTARHK